LRAPSGAVTAINVPGPNVVITNANGINAVGFIVGSYIANQTNGEPGTFAFMRRPEGDFVRFGVPGAGFYGTVAVAINAEGIITGSYSDPGDVSHAFLVIP
jgi:uncharacterized membrane protein